MKAKTFSAKPKDVKRETYVVDAKGKILGRIATKVASILRGKHKTIYTPHIDTGDNVVIINANEFKVTGDKATLKTYFTHSGYPRGDKLRSLKDMRIRDSRKIIQLAVKGMLPKGTLGREMIKKLNIHAGSVAVEGKPLAI